VKVFYCDHFVLPLPPEHSFPMAKYRLLRERIVAEAIVAPGDVLEAEAASWDDIRLAHTVEYVEAVAEGRLAPEQQRRIGFPWSPEMVERARRSVGATLQAARSALADAGGVAANLAGGTHHAFADRGAGFCVFNDVAVAARVLLSTGAIRRALVIDCDVHQGDGTAAMFRGEPAVFTFSMHGAHNFPFRKEQGDLDVAWPDGTTDEPYLAALDVHAKALLARDGCDLVFYVAGADAYEGDRWGRLKLTVEGLRRRDALVFRHCVDAQVPVAVTMGGGYAHDVHAIVTVHANTIREAARAAAARVGAVVGAPVDSPPAVTP
jgi:acetoin utilization deacetylase AcuC-like enzyme